MRKRLTAALLCLCMMLTLLPGTAYAAVGELLGNSRAENQALLEQLEALTGQDGEAIQALLEQYGLLDEDGNLDIDQTVELDGDAYTLAEIEALLDDPDADLSRVGYVDGVPIALGDLKTIIAIERELQRIQETYFSGKAFDGESLANLNSLAGPRCGRFFRPCCSRYECDQVHPGAARGPGILRDRHAGPGPADGH